MHGARDEIERLRPDVIVSDLHLLDGQAITLLNRLQQASPRALLLTTLADDPLLFDTLCGGAHGYWLDQSSAKGLGTALIDFHQRRARMSPALARQTLQAFGLSRTELKLAHCVSSAHDLTPALPGCGLSRSEQHLLSLVAQGLLEGEIAQRWQMEAAEIGQRLGYIYAALHRLRDQVAARFRPPAAPYR